MANTASGGSLDLGSLIGTTLAGRYVVESKLGKGGMAIVYKATDKSFGRSVAIKVLRTDVAKDPIAAKRLVREARAAGQLHHPNIITMHDVGEVDGLVYIVMEVLEGRELSELMEEQGAVGVERSLEIGRQVASALAVAHSNGIIHRDIKPENLFLNQRDGQTDFVKMLDFSIAKLPTNMVTAALTRAGSVFGTPHYMAPEQVEGRPVCAQTDIYALGAVIYELITGEPPFDGNSVIDILLQHAKARPPKLADAGIAIPDGLSELVDSMLGKKESDRPASAAYVEQILAHMLADLRGTSPRGKAATDATVDLASSSAPPPLAAALANAAPAEPAQDGFSRGARPTHPPPGFGPPGEQGELVAPPPTAKMTAASPAPALSVPSDLPGAPEDLPGGLPAKMRAPFGNPGGAAGGSSGLEEATLIGSGLAAKVRAEAERIQRERGRPRAAKREPSKSRQPAASRPSPRGPSAPSASVKVNVPSPPPGRASMPSVRAPGALRRPDPAVRRTSERAGPSAPVRRKSDVADPPTRQMDAADLKPTSDDVHRQQRASQATVAVTADQLDALRQQVRPPADAPASDSSKRVLAIAIGIAAVGLLGLAAAAWLVLSKG